MTVPLSTFDAFSNDVLKQVGPAELQKIAARSTREELKRGTELVDEWAAPARIWMPLGQSMIALSVTIGGGDRVTVGTIGSNGLFGPTLSASQFSLHAAKVMVSGHFLTIDREWLSTSLAELEEFRGAVLRYHAFLLNCLLRNYACNSRHSLAQRCSRRLLELSSHARSTEIALRQEDLATLLSVGRSFVNRTIIALKRDGLIRTSRECIVIADPDGLKKIACGCQAGIDQAYRLAHRRPA
ncbi:MAG: Crp/Fnr family transcriptional regulator [Rhodoblastus sp.]|jgi:CRP-like cAMP-binding protein